MDGLLELSGWLIGAVSFVFALLTELRRRRLSDVIRSNNWFLYQKADNSVGHAQHALVIYKQVHKENIDPGVVEILSKGDAFGQDVLKDTIRLIQMHEPSFSKGDFDRWNKEGKLAPDKVALFSKFAVEATGIPGIVGSITNRRRSPH
jgi:hypothetical protein